MLLVAATPVRAADVRGRLEAALEHDSNPGRAERIEGETSAEIAASQALRGQASLDGAFSTGERGRLLLSGSGAGRVFSLPEARDNDVAIAQGSGDYSYWLFDDTAAAFALSYYEAFQRRTREALDFRSLAPALRVDQMLGAGQLSLGGGYRWFVYKPERDFDFSGPSAFVRYRHLIVPDEDDEEGADWELSALVSVERRAFAGSRCIEDDVCPPMNELGTRIDDFTTVGGEIVRTGDFLLGGGAALQMNRSNSFGAGLVRAALHLKGAVLLPWQVTLSFRGELLISRYTDPLPVSRDPVTGRPRASIEDESRNTVRVELTRPLGERWDVGLRYLFYTNEFGTGPVDYTRHTLMLAVGVAFTATPDR